MLKKSKEIVFNCILTEFYKPIFKKLFLPCFKNSTNKCNPIENKQIHGDYFGAQFKKIIEYKIEKILKSLDEYNTTIWTDVDIVFPMGVDIIIKDLLEKIKDFDLLISKETRNDKKINSGFFIVKSNQKTIKFFNILLKKVKENQIVSEQPTMEDLLYKSNLNWKILPIDYWNLTIGFPLPKKLLMIHANHTPSFKYKLKKTKIIEKKEEILKFILFKIKFKNLI